MYQDIYTKESNYIMLAVLMHKCLVHTAFRLQMMTLPNISYKFNYKTINFQMCEKYSTPNLRLQ